MYADYKVELEGKFKEIIKDFGGEIGKKRYQDRNATNKFDNKEKGAYFGVIKEDGPKSEQYSDLSLVVFPSNDDNSKDKCMIALVVGSAGYEDDYDLASLPGTRRLFINLALKDKFVKKDFADIESTDGINDYMNNWDDIPKSLTDSYSGYKKYILAASVFDPCDDNKDEILKKYIAAYAKLREWDTNEKIRKKLHEIFNDTECINEEPIIRELVKKRKYIVLQGAPGTGKTRMAKHIAEGSKVFFTQFHAETTYSDFVYGIRPVLIGKCEDEVDRDKENKKTNNNVPNKDLAYEPVRGKFIDALEYAEKNDEDVYLIIDEINRANLSNVLGPVFYLFEYMMDESDIEIEVYPGRKIKGLPKNLFVIATMNTADRSLGIVDYALRRRFAWYTMIPHKIEDDENRHFCNEEFNELKRIFEKYATDEELNLMPGQAYFIIHNTDELKKYLEEKNHIAPEEMKERLRYEVMPLIKEYLADGYLARAKDSFISYFRYYIEEEMYK